MSMVVDSRATRSPRRLLQRATFWMPIALIALAVVVGLSVAQVGQRLATTPLDPSSAAPAGSLALVRVLERHGVQVHAVDTLNDALRQAGSDSTVLFYDPAGLLDAGRLENLGREADVLVLVEPDDTQLEALSPGVRFASSAGQGSTAGPDCDQPAALRAGRIGTAGPTYSVEGSVSNSRRCYPDGDGGYSLVELSANRSIVRVLGAGDVLTNGRIADEGNAALALGLLGSRTSLVWYTPGFDDLAGGEPVNAGTLSPQWVLPVIALGIATFLAAAVWRGRRMGPLVAETLPVVVRSTETMEGRARLYERSGARLRALDSLRIGAVSRIATALGLPRSSSVEEVARAAAALLEWPEDRVWGILLTREPQDEAELSALVRELDDLETRITDIVRDPGTRGWTAGP